MVFFQDASGGLEIRHSLNLKTLTLTVPEEEDLQKEFEVEARGRTFRWKLSIKIED